MKIFYYALILCFLFSHAEAMSPAVLNGLSGSGVIEEALTVNGTGYLANWTYYGSGAEDYNDLLADDAYGIASITDTQVHCFDVTDLTTITTVTKVIFHGIAFTTNGDFFFGRSTGAASYFEPSSHSVTSSHIEYTWERTTDPVDDTAWTLADVSALEICVKKDGTTAYSNVPKLWVTVKGTP